MVGDGMKKYGVILADPPWDYRNGGNGRAAAHYPLMTPEQIAKLPVGDFAHDSSVLLMWATWPQMQTAMALVGPAWGFEYVTGFPWIKLYDPPVYDLFGDVRIRPTWGTGAWVRGCSEPVTIWKKKNAKPPQADFMGLISKRMQHSRKPDNLHEYAESFPGPYLELFARRPRAGWDVWGNEVDSTINLQVPE